eukprot:5762114-Prymnesium_polylepis.1
MERPLAWDLGVRQAKPYTVLDKAPERLKQLQKELEAAEVAAICMRVQVEGGHGDRWGVRLL